MKEIGGYMEFETYHGKSYHEGLLALNTARSCIRLILHRKHYTKVYLPIYLCDCIYEFLQKLSVEYEFYSVDTNWLPLLDHSLQENECIYIVNYYGQLTNSDIQRLKEQYKNVILDNTQSFFQKPVPTVDTIYSCRKYFGVSDGSYLSTDIKLNEALEADISYNRFGYLIGRYECGATKFYSDFVTADDSLKEKELMGMSKLTSNILCSLDYSNIEKIRIANFNYLHENLGGMNVLTNLKVGTFMYPFLCKNAETLRNKLIAENIYIPILWPNVLNEADSGSYDYRLAREILPIPIDHRYREEEMSFIISQIKKNM